MCACVRGCVYVHTRDGRAGGEEIGEREGGEGRERGERVKGKGRGRGVCFCVCMVCAVPSLYTRARGGGLWVWVSLFLGKKGPHNNKPFCPPVLAEGGYMG